MDTQTQSNNTSSDLKARITEHIQELAQATDAARVSQEMQRLSGHVRQLSPVLALQRLAHPDGMSQCFVCGRFQEMAEHGTITCAKESMAFPSWHLSFLQ